jgi:hypothetical protein
MNRFWISLAVLLALVLPLGWAVAPAAASALGKPELAGPATPIVLPTNTVPPNWQPSPGAGGPPPAVETPGPEPPPIALPARPGTSPQGPLPPGVAPVRIRFAPGTISAVRTGRLQPWSSAVYVLAARGGQTLEAWVEPASGGAMLYVWGPNGSELIPGQAAMPHWIARLPATGDYFISVNAAGAPADYRLTVVVETLGVRPATRIAFPSGGTSATVSGKLAAGAPARYVLRALAGQTMEVTPAYPTPGLPYAIWGANGVMLRSFGETWGPWRGVLPSSQDYYVEVLSPASANPYRITVTIPPLNPHPTPAPRRISFQPGAISAAVQGHLASGASDRWVVRAMRGQQMSLNISTTSALAKRVVGPGGVSWDWPFVENHPTITLPATGDYVITLTAVEPGMEVWYTMQVVIPP